LNREKEFEVEISNGGSRGYETAIVLELPASWAEFHDAQEKARIRDGRSCEIYLLDIRRKKISQADIGEPHNLYELNLFAQRLSMLATDQEGGFEALLQMEHSNRPSPIPLQRLINLTFNTSTCHIAPHVHSAKDLGALLYEEEMLSDAAAALLDEAEAGSGFQQRLLELLGERHLEKNGGVFTSYGYAEPDGSEWEEVYVPGQMAYFTRSGMPVVLEVRKGFFNTPAYDNHLAAVLDLPANESAISKAIEEVDGADLDECAFTCTDCLIPAAREWINDAIESGDFESANNFAYQLEQKERVWGTEEFTRYKALLQASGCGCLQDAVKLLEETEQYELLPDAAQPWDYARIALQEKNPDLPAILFDTGQGYQAGIELLKRDHASLTDYGAIRRKDRESLPCFGKEQQVEGLQLG